MWLRKLKRKRRQYSLIAVVMLFSVTILAGCVSFIEGMNQNTDRYFEKCADMYSCYYEGEGSEAFEKAVDKNDEIEIINGYKAAEIDGNIKLKGEAFTPFYMMLGAMDDYKKYDMCFNLYEGKDKKAPAADEIWIDMIFAADNDLEIGDTIEIKGKKLSVSGIYRWAIRPVSTYSISSCFVNCDTFEETAKDYKKINCRFTKTNMDRKHKTEFADKIPGQFYNLCREDLKEGVGSMVLVVGGMGAMAAVMIFIASVIVIRFVIKNNIAEEYKTIGIHKALGDLSSTIKGFYVKSYLLAGAAGIFAGSFVGVFFAKILQDKHAIYMEEVKVSYDMVLTSFGCGICLLLVLTFCLLMVLRRIKKITPVEAIRMGMASDKKKLRKGIFKNANSSFAMSVNDIFKKRANSVMMLVMLIVSTFLSVFFINMDYSVKEMGTYRNLWFAVPKSDAMLTGEITDEVIDYLENSEYVKEYFAANLFTLRKTETVNTEEKKEFTEYLRNTSVVSCTVWDEEKTGIRTLEGETPKKANELMMSEKLLSVSGYEIGDYIPLRIDGVKQEFMITGMYATMMSDGNCIGITNDFYEDFGIENQFTEVCVNFKNQEDYSAFKKEMKKLCPDVSVEKVMEAITSAANGVVAMIRPITAMMGFVFVLFSVTIIIILLEMEQQNNRNQYGILKALGRTNGYLCRKMFWKVGILSVLGMLAGVWLDYGFAGEIFQTMVGVNAMVIDTKSTLLILGVMAVTIIGVTAMFCLPLRRVSPRELMEE